MLQLYECCLPFGQGQVPILHHEEIQEDNAQFVNPSEILRLTSHGRCGAMHAMGQGEGYASQEENTENKQSKKRENFVMNAVQTYTPHRELPHSLALPVIAYWHALDFFVPIAPHNTASTDDDLVALD